jgi:hypothetical protein
MIRSTSIAAWHSFVPFSAALDRQICEALERAGSAGLICQEIETAISREHQAVSGNLRHLVEREVVRPTRLRGRTRSGRSAIKWVLAEFFDEPTHGEIVRSLVLAA